MKVSLKTKFKSIDLLFDFPGVIFKTELIKNHENQKKFNILYPKDNEKERQEIMKKINTLLEKGDEVLDGFKDNDFIRLSEKMKSLTEETEIVGCINCSLMKNKIKVDVFYRNDLKKEFIFTEDDYFDQLLDYLENDYAKIILNH